MSKPKLEVVVNNSERDLLERRIDKEFIVLQCLRPICRHRWKATIADCENPVCPKCKREV